MDLLKSTICLFALMSLASCSLEGDNLCMDLLCQNNKKCDDPCNCAEDLSGRNSGNFDPSHIQTYLDDSITPKELYDGGVHLDSIYGKRYKGGLIFFLNTTNGTGLVSAKEDLSAEAIWGCNESNIERLPNVTTYPVACEREIGARIGDGTANTDMILASCASENIAARICRNLGAEWFLPSRGELRTMYSNLKANGNLGNFNGYYWSSTEVNFEHVWVINFNIDYQAISIKGSKDIHVRAARAF